MQSHIRRQIQSFIIPEKQLIQKKKKQPTSILTINKKQQQISKSLTVHEFDQAVNLIFRPKRIIRPNKPTRPNALTDRNAHQQKSKQQKEVKSSSLQKSFSLLKRLKDFIVPQSFSFLKFNKPNQQKQSQNIDNLSLSISSKLSEKNKNPNFSKQENQTKFPNEDLVAQRRVSGISSTSNDEQFFIIPQLKISLPKQSSKEQQSNSRKSSRIIQSNQLNEISDERVRKNSLMSSIFSSKRSQKSQVPKISPTSSLSKITNPNFNLLKTEHIEGKKLKYFSILGHSLTQVSATIYVLVGNENQIDCLCMSRMAKQDLIDIELAWSLNLQKGDQQKGKITSIAFDSLKSIFIYQNILGSYITLLSNDLKIIQIYRYSTKQFTKPPTFIANINIQSPIHTMHMIKQNQIILFYQSKLVEVYSIELHSQVKKKYQKQLDSKIQVKKNVFNQLEILSIGEPFMNSITVYLSCDQSQTANPFLFDLLIIEITFHGQGETIMSKPHRVYSIKKELKQLLKFDNFSQRFFLLYVGLEVIAVMKQGYMIDSAKVDIQQEKSLLKYVGRNRLLLVTQSKIEQYEFNLNEDIPPYRLNIKSLDSILLPENYDSKIYEFLDAVPIFQSINTNKSLFQQTQFFTFYLLCFQLKYDQNKKVLTGQVPYILTMTNPVSVKQKADKLFHFEGRNIQTVDMKEIQEKVDIAKKMGLKVKDIYLDLWNRTKKNTVKDFCFLLDTLDYEVISKEIQKKLKKQAMVYTELTKIESSCFFLLKKKVFSPECTETDVKNYIVSHFKLKKYYFFKDVSKFCENQQAARDQLKKPQKPVSSESSLKSPHSITESQRERREREEKKLMFDIQAFYTYNQMELKSYLLQLFQKYFYEISESPSFISKGKEIDMFKYAGKFPLIWAKKKDYLLKIKIMMNNFRFQLKMIYEEFLQELIKLTEKGDMIIELLNDFEEILPRSFTGHVERSGHSLEQVKDNSNEEDEIRVTKRIEISKIKRSLSKSTQGELELEGIWRQIPDTQFQHYLYLQNIETIYNKSLIQTLSKDIWFKRNLYSQHDLILKTKQQILQIDNRLNSSYIFYFFIDRVYEYVTSQSVRKDVIQLIDHNYSSVLPKHLKGKIQLYYQLYLQTKKLSKQYVETLHKQAKNPINQSAGLRTSTINLQGPSALNFFLNLTQQSKMNPKSNQQYKKSLYETFLPPKSTEKSNHLDSFQNFLKLSQIQLFSEFIKLEYILVGCIFHRIKPVYEKFWKGREIFNEIVQKYFQSKSSEISHLKCLLNRMNSQSKEFQAQHFDLYEVLVKSVMVKVQIGAMIPQKEYVNVDQLIIYIRDIYMVNQNKINNKKGLKSNNFYSGKNSPNQSFSNSKISGFGLHKLTPKSIDFDHFLSSPPRQSKIQTFFNILGCVSENKQLFRNLKIRISLYDIYGLHQNNKTQTITTLIVQYLIEYESFYELESYQQFEGKTIELLVQAAMILNKLYTSPQDFIKKHMDFPLNDQKTSESQNFQNQLFFILLWKIMSNERYVYNGWIFRLLQNKDITNTYRVNEILKENLVIFMCKYRFSLDKLFVNNIQYLECLIILLPQTNRIRKYFASQIQFVKAIQPNYQEQKLETKFQCHNVKPKIMNPLTQNSEVISIFHIEQIFSLYPSEYLLKLNLEKICEIVNQMQKILLEVAVKQRLADHTDFRYGQASLIQSMDEKQAGFGRFERQNSGKFLFSMKKSLDLIEDRDNFFSACNTPIYTPQFQNLFAPLTDKEINLLQLETLVRQSAQPQTFFKETETKLIKSVKLIRERGSLAFQSSYKQQQKQKIQQQKQIQESIAQFENLSQYYTSLSQIYEVVVKRLINSQMIKQVLQHLQKLLKLSQLKDQKVNQLYVVYPLLILNIISRQLIPQNRILLVKIASHLFKEPMQLLKFIKQLIGKKDKQIFDLSQLQSSVIFFSMADLNRKLIEYEKKARFYKVQYTGFQKQPNQVDDNYKKIEETQEPKHLLKKKLIIKIEDDQESEQIILPNKLTQKFPSKDEVRYMKRPFSYENPIIAAHCIDTISSQPQKLKFIQHIWTLFETLHRQKELFSKDFEFMIMNVMLFQQPYTIVKYLQTKLKGWYLAGLEQSPDYQTNLHNISSNVMLKFKPLMSYFNEMIKEPCINPLRLLQFGKRMFYMLYCTIVERSSIEYQISQYYQIPLTQTIPCDEFPDSPISQLYTTKFKHSIEAFSKKQRQIRKKMTQSGKFMPEVNQTAFQASKKNNQIHLFIKQVASYQDFSPNKFSAASKQDLLEISYNNIEDSLSQNLQTPLVAHNPSKLSEFSKGQESFDPSKQRELVYSRGQKRFSAMLSNNSSIILKNKLSPKSIKSGKNPSVTFFSSENSKIKKKNERYFRSDKDIKKIDIRKKKTFDGMTQIQGSNGEIVYHHQESIIFQQDFQNSRNVSEVDINENFCIEPPKLINKETDRLFNSSSLEESKIQRSRNLVTEDMNSSEINQKNDQFRWTQRNQFHEQQVQDQFFSTIQPSPHKNQHKDLENNVPKAKGIQKQKNKKLSPQKFTQMQKLPSPIKGLSNKKDREQINIILEEDQLATMSLKQISGCEFDADVTVTHKKIQQVPKNKQTLSINAPIKRTTGRNTLAKNKISDISKDNSIKEEKNLVKIKQNTMKSDKSLQSPPQKNVSMKKNENITNSPNLELSNQVRKLSKSINEQKSQNINEFSIPHNKDGLKDKQNDTKFKRKNEVQNAQETVKSATETKKQTKKVLTVQIPTDDITQIKKPQRRFSSQIESEKIPMIIISPRHRSSQTKPMILKNFVRQNSAKQNHLLIKIRQLLTKNGLQMFLLTELEDIYEKFRDYLQKYEDIIPGMTGRSYQNESEIGGNQTSRLSQKSGESNTNQKKLNKKTDQKQFTEPKSLRVDIRKKSAQQDLSLQLSHSHQSYEHEHQQIELFSNWQNANHILQQEVLFTKQQLYELMQTYLNNKIKQTESQQQQLPESQILLQQLKDKLFYDICMQRLLQNFTNENNINTIAKIIDKVFGKKIFVTDYYYEVISKKEVQHLQRIVEKVAEQATVRTFRYTSSQTQNKPMAQKQTHNKITSVNKFNNLSQKSLSPRANSIPKNSPLRFDKEQNTIQKSLETQMNKLQNLLEKIPLNILQYRKKQLMLKLKPGKQMGRKYLLDVLVKVFEKKKDKKLGQEIHLRLKNIIDKDIKM